MNSEVITEKQDLTWLTWSKLRNSSGTAGSFLKATSKIGGDKIYYKLSNYDSVNGIIGHECVNEIIVDRLLTVLGVEHLKYQLIHADVCIRDQIYENWLCASKDFKQQGESKIALDTYYDLERIENETPLDFCIRQGWSDYIWKMLVVDFLILNRDRHGANIEVLRNGRKKTMRLAPLFDHGLSLIFNCQKTEAVMSIDVLADRPIQCFVGSHSAFDNLKLIPRQQFPKINCLKETDQDILFKDLEQALPKAWQLKIWEMIWKRWQFYENFCS